MRHFKKLFRNILVITLAVCMTSMPVMAQEVSQPEKELITQAVVPSGYTLIATYSRTPQTYYLGTTSVRNTSTFQLYLPNESNRDWIQGTVTFTPVTSGATSGSFDFSNLSGENKTFNLSSLTPGTTYQVRVYAYAFGSSNKATAYYKMNY